jgi:HAD superfamily hydrolase (TIGR01509 family)
MIELVVFDWDGVIRDSDRLQAEAEQVTARQITEESELDLDIDEVDWTKYKGWGRVKIAADLFGVLPTSDLAETYRESVVDTTVEIMGEHNLNPVKGALPFIDYMRFRVGNMAVATSSNRRILEPSTQLFGLQDYFRETVAHRECLDDKPKPGQYREVMRRLDVKPQNTLVIEDSASGITSGRYSGALVLAIATTKSPEYLRASTDANLVAESFKHATHILQPFLS